MQYGSILAKQFDVPQQRQQAAATGRAGRPAGGGGPADFKFDDYGLKPFDGLDRSNPDVAQAAQQYYQDWAALRSFAKTMWVKYGVDVMSPDPGDENAIWANQAFNQKLALLMNNVDRAKNDFEVWKADQAAQREGKMIGRDYMGSASTMGLDERGMATAIDPTINLAAQELSGSFSTTPQDVNARNQRIQALQSELENRYQGKALEYQKEAANKLLAGFNPPNQNPYFNSGGGQALALMGRVAATIAGAENYTPTGIIDPKTGFELRKSTNNPIVQYYPTKIHGKPAVAAFRSGKKFILVNEDGANGQYDTNTNAIEFDSDKDAYGLIYGTLKAQGMDREFEQYRGKLQEQGVLKQEGDATYVDVNNPKLLGPTAAQEAQAVNNQPNYQEQIKATKDQVSALMKDMLRDDTLWDKIKRIPLPLSPFKSTTAPTEEAVFDVPIAAGYKIKITPVKQGGKKLLKATIIDDAGESYKTKDGKPVEKQTDEPTEIQDFLDSFYATNSFIKNSKAPITPKFKAPNGYAYTREQLKAAGWTDADIDALPVE